MGSMDPRGVPLAEEITEEPRERSIGDIIRDSHQLSASQMERVLAYQRDNGVRIGEALVR
jgi:hypothetical protein